MSADAYELAALTARYIFTALMLLIVFRAERGALIDSRRAAKLRHLSPATGRCGEMVVLEGDGNARRGVRYPVIREGCIGSSSRCDIRIRHGSVRRRHAIFQLNEKGLRVRTHAGSRLRDGHGRTVKEMTLRDGDSLFVGGVKLLLVLSLPEQPKRRPGAVRGRASADPFNDWLDDVIREREFAPEAFDADHHRISPIFSPADEFDDDDFAPADEISPIFRSDDWDPHRARKKYVPKREPAPRPDPERPEAHEPSVDPFDWADQFEPRKKRADSGRFSLLDDDEEDEMFNLYDDDDDSF